jgi:hypothetical protein
MKKAIKILSLSVLFFLTVFLVIASILIFNYIKWEKGFEENWNTKYLAEHYDEIPAELQSDFFEFVASDEKNNFIEISASDFSDLIYFVAKDSVEGVNVQNIYVRPSEGVWRVYAELRMGYMYMPWFSLDLIKDDRETAELYVKNLYLGDIKLTKVLTKKLIAGINTGISEALLQFNENLFSKRYIQNIELSSENAIIKGVLY